MITRKPTQVHFAFSYLSLLSLSLSRSTITNMAANLLAMYFVVVVVVIVLSIPHYFLMIVCILTIR